MKNRTSSPLSGVMLIAVTGFCFVVWWSYMFQKSMTIGTGSEINARALFFGVRDTPFNRVEVGKTGADPVFVWKFPQGGEAQISVWTEGGFTVRYFPDHTNQSCVHMLAVRDRTSGVIRDGFMDGAEDTIHLWGDFVARLPKVVVADE